MPQKAIFITFTGARLMEASIVGPSITEPVQSGRRADRSIGSENSSDSLASSEARTRAPNTQVMTIKAVIKKIGKGVFEGIRFLMERRIPTNY